MRFVILGFGKFGKLALERILAGIPDSTAIVVDAMDPGPSPRTGPRVEFMRRDAIEFLAQDPRLSEDDVVVPMVPFNVAAKYVIAVNPGAQEIPLPPGIEADLPNPVLLSTAFPKFGRTSSGQELTTETQRHREEMKINHRDSETQRHREEMKTPLRALREKILSDLQGSPVAVLKNTSPYLRKEALRREVVSTLEDVLSAPASSLEPVAVLPHRSPGLPMCLEPAIPAGGPHADRPKPTRSSVADAGRPVQVDGSALCCSRADFLCPDDCPEGDLCSVTGMPRERPLFEIIEGLRVPGFATLVQRSHQILPGVGGYSVGELRSLALQRAAGRYLIATSCKCHGIVTAVRIEERRISQDGPDTRLLAER